MERVTGSFLIYDDIIRIEYECEMAAEYDVWELRKVNEVRVFVGEHRAYMHTYFNSLFFSNWVHGLARIFYEPGCSPEAKIDIHESIERDAIERLKDREPDFEIPENSKWRGM